MGEHSNNIMSELKKSQPGIPDTLGFGLSHRVMLRPGLAIIKEAASHRVFEGRHQVHDKKADAWLDLGSDDVWIIETQGEPPPDVWVIGVFLAMQIVDKVALSGKRRIVTAQTNSLIACIPISDAKAIERELNFGAGQSSLLSQ